MSDKPFFSIGIPIYRCERWLGRCLDSVLSQDFEDFEVICVNDGPSPESEEIAESYRRKDKRIKILRKENGGPSSVRNYFIYAAKGEYIFTVDGDDEITPGALKKAYETAVKYDFPDVISAGFIRVRGEVWDECPTLGTMDPVPYDVNNPIPADRFNCEELLMSRPDGITKDENWINFYLDNSPAMQCQTKFVKRDFIDKNGISFSCRLLAQEDHDWSFEVFRKADRVVFSNFYAFLYYKGHDGSLTTQWSSKSIYTGISRWFNLFGDVEFMDLTPRTKQRFLRQRDDIARRLRRFTLGLISSRSRRDAFYLADTVDAFFGRQIRKLPAEKEDGIKNRIIYFLYRHIGIMPTFSLLYRYLEARKLTYRHLGGK